MTVGLSWLTRTDVDSSYTLGVLGPTVTFGFGMGLIFVPVMLMAVSGVPAHETGAASGLLNSVQQIGGSVGLSILTTVFAKAAASEGTRQQPDFLAHAAPADLQYAQQHQAFPPGTTWANEVLAYAVSHAFVVGVAFAAVALLSALFVVKAKASDLPAEAPAGMAI